MTLKNHSDQIFTFEFQQRLGPGTYFPARSTIIRLDHGNVVIISPGPFSDKVVSQIKAMGQQITIIAPNLFHHFYINKALAHFPNTQLYAPSGMGKKIKSLHSRYTDIAALPKDISSQVEPMLIQGHKILQEWVFFHKKSGTLICTDLIFNIRTANMMTQWILRLAGAFNKLAQSRLIKVTTSDKQAFKSSISSLKSFKAQRIIMAHGEIIDEPQKWQSFLENFDL